MAVSSQPARGAGATGVTLERVLGVLAIVTIVAAWFAGGTRSQANLTPYLAGALPAAQRFEALRGGVYAGWAAEGSAEHVVGYVAVGEATGYGGPLKVAVGVDPQGNIIGVSVLEHRETPAYFSHVLDARLPAALLGKSFADPFALGGDVDAVSGATYTSRALADAVRQAGRQIASQQLGLAVPPEPARPIRFGVPELVLLGLYAAGFVGHQQRFKYKKQARWVTMLAGLVAIGFLYNSPLTLSNINSLLLGFWPEWQTHLYWYLLIGGIVFVYTVDNKNPYCEWFCPFGAAQECLGAIGGAKPRTPSRYRDLLRWTQRAIAWAAIVIALVFRNPGLSSYEPFGTLFAIRGSGLQFALLAIVLLASLFIRRPWCTYLCPLRPVTDFIRLVRNWIGELWIERIGKPILRRRQGAGPANAPND